MEGLPTTLWFPIITHPCKTAYGIGYTYAYMSMKNYLKW